MAEIYAKCCRVLDITNFMHCRVIKKEKKKNIQLGLHFFPLIINLLQILGEFQFWSTLIISSLDRTEICIVFQTLSSLLVVGKIRGAGSYSMPAALKAFDRPVTSTIRPGYRSSRKREVARVYLTKTVASCAETSLAYLLYYVLRCTSNVLLI